MPDVQDIAVKPLPGISFEEARDARARAWSFVFRCWQAKQMAVEPAHPNDYKRLANKERRPA